MRKITVVIADRPPTPNARRDWRVTARENKDWKQRAWIAAMDAMSSQMWPTDIVHVPVSKTRTEPRLIAQFPMVHCELDVTIVVPDDRGRDFDNGVASLKPLIDGCVAARIIMDDSTNEIVDFHCRYAKQKGESRVELTFTEVQRAGTLGL